MRSKILSLFMVAFAILLPGCKSYENGGVEPGMARVSVRMLATAATAGLSKAGRTSRLAMGDSVTFESILLGVSKLEFQPKDTTQNDSTSCNGDHHGDNEGDRWSHWEDDDEDKDGDKDNDNDSTELEFKGAFVVDLLHGTSTPDFGIAQVVPGTFSEIEIKLSPVLPDSNSIFVKGKVFVGDTSYVFEFSSKMQMKLKIHSKEGIELDGSLNSILVTLDLDRFFENINLSSAHIDENGVIKINPSFNPGIFAFLHLRLGEALRCGKDEDKDGDID